MHYEIQVCGLAPGATWQRVLTFQEEKPAKNMFETYKATFSSVKVRLVSIATSVIEEA